MGARPQSHYARGHAKREQLLDAAVEMIAAQGIEGITHRSVAAAAGVPLSTTSYFFTSMDDLIGAAVTRVADGVLQAAESLVAAAATLDGEKSLSDYVDELVEVVTASREAQVRAQFEAYLATSRRPELAESVRQIVEGFERAAESFFAPFGVANPSVAARELVALLDGFALQRVAHPRTDDREVLREAVRRLAVSLEMESPVR